MKKFVVLLLISSVFGASSVDTAIYAPTLVNAIPDLSISPGQSVTLDFKYNINCSSTATPTTNNPVWSVTPTVVGNGTLALSSVGVLTGIPASSVSGYVVKCVNNTSPVVGASDTFNLTISGSGPVVATGYFIDCVSGNNANAGTTYSAPWLTLSKATALASGSNVWLKAGTICDLQQLLVNWNGTSSNPVVIGTYYVSNGVAYVDTPAEISNVRARPDTYTYSNGARAIIQGSYTNACRLAGNNGAGLSCPYGQTDLDDPLAVPMSRHDALVKITGDYVTVQDLEVRYSAGEGIMLDAPGDGKIDSRDVYGIIQRNYSHNHAGRGIVVYDAGYWVVRENHVTHTGESEVDRPDANSPFGPQRNGVGIALARDWDAHALIENNVVHDIYSENMVINNKVSKVLVRGNVSGNGSQIDLYILAQDVVVEQNLLVSGTVDDEGVCTWGTVCTNLEGPIVRSTGLTIEDIMASVLPQNDPTLWGNKRVLVRNNLFAGALHAVDWTYWPCWTAASTPPFCGYGAWVNAGNIPPVEGWWYGNTLIAQSGTQPIFYSNSRGVAHMQLAKNNLFSGSASSTCQMLAPYTGGLVSQYNLFPSTIGANCAGTGNVVSTTTGLGTLAGLADVTANLPLYSDFQITHGATDADEAGTALTTAVYTGPDWTWVLSQRRWMSECQTAQVSEAEFIKQLTTDYCGITRGNPPDIGAFED